MRASFIAPSPGDPQGVGKPVARRRPASRAVVSCGDFVILDLRRRFLGLRPRLIGSDNVAATNPLRVAVDLRALVPEPSGIGVYTRSLLLALAARGNLELLGLAHRPPQGADELRAAGVAIEHQPAPKGVVWQQLLLPRRLRRGDVSLLWSPVLTLPLFCPVPAVVTVHDLTTLLMPEAHRLKVRWSILPFLRRSIESARAIVTLSQATAVDLARHFPECTGKVRVVYPGVDREFRPGAADEVVDERERRVEISGIGAAALREVGAAAALAADGPGDLLDELAGLHAPGQVLRDRGDQAHLAVHDAADADDAQWLHAPHVRRYRRGPGGAGAPYSRWGKCP